MRGERLSVVFITQRQVTTHFSWVRRQRLSALNFAYKHVQIQCREWKADVLTAFKARHYSRLLEKPVYNNQGEGFQGTVIKGFHYPLYKWPLYWYLWECTVNTTEVMLQRSKRHLAVGNVLAFTKSRCKKWWNASPRNVELWKYENYENKYITYILILSLENNLNITVAERATRTAT